MTVWALKTSCTLGLVRFQALSEPTAKGRGLSVPIPGCWEGWRRPGYNLRWAAPASHWADDSDGRKGQKPSGQAGRKGPGPLCNSPGWRLRKETGIQELSRESGIKLKHLGTRIIFPFFLCLHSLTHSFNKYLLRQWNNVTNKKIPVSPINSAIY